MTDKRLNYLKENKEILSAFTKAITKIHGDHYPQVHKVREIYEKIEQKVNVGDDNLNTEFKLLREVTLNYQTPTDSCEAFKTVYQTLKTADELANN